MLNGLFSVTIAAALVLPAAVSASAQPVVRTSYTYYNISGSSLPELRQAMISKRVSANGVMGYGMTSPSLGREMSVASCKATGNYRFSVTISEKLPRADTSQLSPADASRWNSFAQFVRRHEDTHRAIWVSCAADAERKFVAGGTQDCGSAHSRAIKIYNEMIAQCKPKQVAFDAQQRGVLKSHPFIKYASR